MYATWDTVTVPGCVCMYEIYTGPNFKWEFFWDFEYFKISCNPCGVFLELAGQMV